MEGLTPLPITYFPMLGLKAAASPYRVPRHVQQAARACAAVSARYEEKQVGEGEGAGAVVSQAVCRQGAQEQPHRRVRGEQGVP